MNRKLFRSSAFRLTLLYMMLFGASVAVLLVFIYTKTQSEMEEQIKDTIDIQLADLGRKFVVDGRIRTIDTINHLIEKDMDNNLVYLLFDKKREILAGNLSEIPSAVSDKNEWITIPLLHLSRPDGTVPLAIAITSSLPRGHTLLVGYNLESVERVQQIIARTIAISIVFIVALGGIGGGMLAWFINRRLEVINQTCRKVMAGELNQRVAVSGSDDEFDHLAENFNAMLARIGELIDGIRDISANVAHDLRTPLNKLRNRIEIMEKEYKNNPERAYGEMRYALRDIDALVATFNSILRISQAEGGAGIEHFQPTDLSQTLGDVADFYLALAEDKHIQLSREITPDVMIHGDKHLLAQAFANLLDNAIKYTPEGGNVVIAVRAEGMEARVTIADSGPGIPAEYYGRVTQKFFRMEESRTTAGNGLGLSLASAAFKLHGGAMQFSENTPGLRVDVTLPLAR